LGLDTKILDRPPGRLHLGPEAVLGSFPNPSGVAEAAELGGMRLEPSLQGQRGVRPPPAPAEHNAPRHPDPQPQHRDPHHVHPTLLRAWIPMLGVGCDKNGPTRGEVGARLASLDTSLGSRENSSLN